VDLTAVPIGGFWTSWLPFALPQCWPFCWWVVVVIDHYSPLPERARQPTCSSAGDPYSEKSYLGIRFDQRLSTTCGQQFGVGVIENHCAKIAGPAQRAAHDGPGLEALATLAPESSNLAFCLTGKP